MNKVIQAIDCKGQGLSALNGTVIHERYRIIKAINQGSFGHIYEVEDLEKGEKIVLKVQEDNNMIAKEIQTMKKVNGVFNTNVKKMIDCQADNEITYQAVPQIIDYGMLELHNFGQKNETKQLGFYLMPLYEMNLKQYLSQLKGAARIQKILEVAYKLIGIFKYVHTARRTFNDLKPENVMINTNGDLEAEPEVYLIDFGFADKYTQDDSKTHIDPSSQTDMFEGNLLFASLNQMNFMRTSRRDDIISVFYLMMYLINGSAFPELTVQEDTKVNEQFEQVKQYKNKHFPTMMVEKLNMPCFADAEHITIQENLFKIAVMTEGIQYSDKPSYSYFKEKLNKCLIICKDQQAAKAANNLIITPAKKETNYGSFRI